VQLCVDDLLLYCKVIVLRFQTWHWCRIVRSMGTVCS